MPTPLKTNMSPEKGPFQKENNFPTTIFQGACNFSGEYRWLGCEFFPFQNAGELDVDYIKMDDYPIFITHKTLKKEIRLKGKPAK